MPEPGYPELLVFDSDFELLRFGLEEGVKYVLHGDVDSRSAWRIHEAIEAEAERGDHVELMMEEAELLDAASVTRMVETVRLLVSRHRRVRLVRSPQTLAHSLYRLGMLVEGAPLELIEPREEEGSAS